jgi:hypothetical protein
MRPSQGADAEPTACAPATLYGKELGRRGGGGVARLDRELREARERRRAKQSDASESRAAEAGAEPQQSSSSASSSVRAIRGPDHFRRSHESHTVRDQGGDPGNPSGWAYVDIGRVVRLFRADRVSYIRLRKLHVRWCHASADATKIFLDSVGVTAKVLEPTPEICRTCSVRRGWAKPARTMFVAQSLPTRSTAG